MVGAGAALLLTPQTGEEVRHELARRGRRWRVRTADAWDDLRDELQYAARRGRRKLGRALRRRRQNRERQNESVLDD
jgi:gas vesicle protein